jgi:tetratricopeptide (TPR) repeat protein
MRNPQTAFPSAEVRGQQLLQRLESNPLDAAAYDALGVLAMDHESAATAVDLFHKAIQLDGPRAGYCVHLGEAFARLGDYARASACMGQALQADPARHDVRWAYANLLHLHGEHEGAARNYEALVRETPRHAEAWFNLGVTRGLQGEWEAAKVAYQYAIGINPTCAEAWNNLALLEVRRGDLSEAEACYRRALLVRPNYRDALYNFAVLLQDQERLQEAVLINERLIAADPSYAEAHNNLGTCLLKLNRVSEARRQYLEALGMDATHREAPMNLGICSLLLGDFEQGWAGYEHRLQQLDAVNVRWSIPRWDGKAYPGQRLLVHAEQGLGDTIQFARYLRPIEESGMRISVICPAPLSRLLEQSAPVEVLNGEIGEADWQIPFPSLPLSLRTRLDTIPKAMPYLKASPEQLANWQRVFAELPRTGRRVGLAWQGNPKHRNDRNRSIPLQMLEPLLETPGWQFFSLQLGAPRKLPDGLFDLSPLLVDLSETAAAIECLDLVISVDSAVAHLAGALNQRVWTLLPYAPDWRWMLHREDTPWYPSMRLIRQPIPGEWPAVINDVRRALAELS